MILRAQADLGIDLARSWLVGDSAADIGAARQAGVRSILVRSGGVVATMLATEPDYEVADLAAAADFIIAGHDALTALVTPLAAQIAPGSLVRIAGQSRQGKSLCASVLANVLARRGSPAAHLRLDRWLRPVGQRPDGAGVREAIDWRGYHETLAPWLAGRALDAELPGYAPGAGSRISGPRLVLPADAVLVLDGTLAMGTETSACRTTLDLFIDGDEGARAERFAAEYARRGHDQRQIEALYRQRLADEVPLVEAQRQKADIVLRMPSR